MLEYKVIDAKNSAEAEKVMNTMAAKGWEVVDVTYWQKMAYRLVITFKKNN
ncbi:MAG TPA: DUF4177 domain-containing protein [Clostridiales bacterium]|nr:DUF4177 domain-containing protein [Clostridiales bacterium]